MPLKVSHGIGSWIKDFKKSDAPQFKGKSEPERRDMAIAAYLDAKKGSKNEAYDNPPFTPDPPKKDVKNSDQTKQSPMSRAKALAKKARDAQKTESVEENVGAPQTAAHRRAMLNPMRKRAQDNEKARQALKDPDHNPAWASSKSKVEATLVRGKEVHDKTFANRTQADNFAKKNGGRVRQVGRVFYVFKESVNEGRPSQQHPLEDHPYHKKSDAQLIYIGKDAHKAAEAMKGHNTSAENKYRDQANDAATVRHFRKKSGMPDWYKKKYGHGVKESVELDEAFKVGDKVKAKKGSQANNQRHYERKVGTIVKDYKDGDFKVNFGGHDDTSISGKDLVKESVELDESVAKAYEIMKPTKSMNHGIEAIKKTMKVDHGTATRLARQVMDKVKKGEFKEGTEDRLKMIKKIGDKINKEKKKAERDAMKHAKRDNEYQTENVEDEGASAANAGTSYANNPYPKGSPNHLAWSKGHNKARARRLNMGEAKLDELKKSTLGNYVKVAAKDAASKAYGAASAAKDNRADQAGKDFSKSMKRLRGIDTATKKLTKEAKLDELSPATHDKYQKAAQQDASKGIAQMRMGARTAKSAVDNEKKRQKGIDTSKFLNRKQHGVKPTYEEFTMKQYRKNEDENRHSENALQLAKKFGTKKEIETVQGIHDRHMKRGHITEPDRSTRDKIAKNHYPKLKEDTSVKKTNEATQFKVDIDGLPPTFIQGKSVGEIMANLRKIVKQPSMIKDVERVTDYTVKKTYRAKAQGKDVAEAANADEGSMALTQLEFIEYAADELSDYIKKGGDFPEWMQNKLTKVHTTIEGLHSSMGDHGGDDDENEKDD